MLEDCRVTAVCPRSSRVALGRGIRKDDAPIPDRRGKPWISKGSPVGVAAADLSNDVTAPDGAVLRAPAVEPLENRSASSPPASAAERTGKPAGDEGPAAS
jgi:hypothetical protein